MKILNAWLPVAILVFALLILVLNIYIQSLTWEPTYYKEYRELPAPIQVETYDL